MIAKRVASEVTSEERMDRKGNGQTEQRCWIGTE